MRDGVLTAVLYSAPRKGGLYVMQVHFPPRTRLPVHSHPDERVRTVLSGTHYSSVGDKFDAPQLVAIPAGTVSHVPVVRGGSPKPATKLSCSRSSGWVRPGSTIGTRKEDPRRGKR
jgi:hypothetical protein